jgi:hypothetical protein
VELMPTVNSQDPLLNPAPIVEPAPAETIAIAPVTPAPTTPVSPQIPAEGLPDGWTMEQWNYYGEDWLKTRNRL